VFVALDGGKFEPRTITLGPRAEGDFYQVLGGLKPGERVVTSGQFMLDSESQLREAIQKMMEPGGAVPHSDAGGMVHAAAAGPEATGPAVYLCPMPEHVSVQYNHPGKCPLCGMTLVPVGRAWLDKVQPGGKVEYYACPMPEDAGVHSDKPGKCPKCGMTLIPVMETHPAAAAPPPAPLPTLYTCPMASDADVVSDHPGKCPKCEMDLVETSKVKHGNIAEEHWRKGHPAAAGAKSPSAEAHDHAN